MVPFCLSGNINGLNLLLLDNRLTGFLWLCRTEKSTTFKINFHELKYL